MITEQIWKREPTIYENEGWLPPEISVEERTVYYSGPNEAKIAVIYYVQAWDARHTNQPYDPERDYAIYDGVKVLFGVEEANVFIPAEGDEIYEYAEGSPYWYSTLEQAVKKMDEMIACDESDTFLWDGKEGA